MYDTFCRETLKYDTFCRETLKYGTFCRKNLDYALRAKNGKFALRADSTFYATLGNVDENHNNDELVIIRINDKLIII